MSKPINIELNDGHLMPQLGLGVWQIPDEEAQPTIEKALEIGYRHFDSAQGYENEAGVGRAIAATSVPRGEIYVTSKLRNKLQGFDETLRAFDDSMERLGLEYLDLFLIHWPWPAAGKYVETWNAFVELKETGRVRSIGVSNFNPDHLDNIIAESGVIPAVNQVELHMRFQQVPLRKYHEQKGIVTQSWSPLGKGNAFEDPTVVRIAKAHGKTPAQIILRWHLDSDLVTFPKSVNPDRLVENFSIFDFELSGEEIQELAKLDDEGGRFGPKPEELDVAF